MSARRAPPLCSAWGAIVLLGCSKPQGVPVGPPRSELPLVQAAMHGDQSALNAQLAGGARVDAQDRRGRTALMEAASYNRVDMVRELLLRGAEPDLRDNGRSTALLIADSSGNDAAVEALLDGGADPNGRGWRGRTPLMAAVDNRLNDGFQRREGVVYPVELLGTVRLLLAHGSDASLRDEEGRTALSIAQARGLERTAKALRQALARSKPKGTREP